MQPDETVADPAVRTFAVDRAAAAIGRSQRIDVAVLTHRPDYWVLRCISESSRQSVVLKLAGPDCPYPASFALTAAVTDRARLAGVPVSKVLEFVDSYRDGPWRYLVQEFVGGHEWRHLRRTLSVRDAASADEQLAEVVVALHSVRFDAFGPLGSDALPTSSLDLFTALEQRAMANIADERKAAAFASLLRRESQLFTTGQRASLCHDDLHHRNIIIERAGVGVRLRAVLDWDKAWSGPLESDLARMALWDDMTSSRFWSSYRARRPQADGEEERRLIYQLLWCFEYDAPTPRHRRDTARLARRLGVQL